MNIQNPVPKPRTTGSGDHHEELQSYPSAYDDGKCNDNGGKHRRRDYTPSSYGPLPQRQGLATDTDINQGCFALQRVGLSSAKAVKRRSTPPVISSGPRSRQSPSARASTLRSASWGNPHVH